ncbi:MAG: glutamate--cysteine ligase [Deltaproteobacteria bacterium]|nr:MAG: glutamate--cysteine ligase [Deltaproteobacteria bacterium]
MSTPPTDGAPSPLTRDQLVAAFHSYGTPREGWRVGGEFERALVHADGRPVGYSDPRGIRWVLERLAADGWRPEFEGDNPIALYKDGASITLEPGGQVELSGAPHRRLADLAAEAAANRAALRELVADGDLTWIAAGLTPIADIDDIEWVPKGRYVVMREYLPLFGDLAHFMMKGTCSVQANFDYADEADCARKVRLAAGLAPLTTALMANSPLYRNQPTGFKSYRAHIWTRTDPSRTGFPRALREQYTHEGWVDYLLDVPMMFYKVDGEWLPARGRSFRVYMEQGFDGHRPGPDDWALHQTSVFPEVRVKHTIEIRGADCVDHDLAIAFCALWTGLMYCPQALADGLDLVAELGREGTAMERFAAAARGGLDGVVSGRPLSEWARELGVIAERGMRRCMPDDLPLLDPLLARIDAGRCPADDLLDAWRADPSPEAIIRQVAY